MQTELTALGSIETGGDTVFSNEVYFLHGKRHLQAVWTVDIIENVKPNAALEADNKPFGDRVRE